MENQGETDLDAIGTAAHDKTDAEPNSTEELVSLRYVFSQCLMIATAFTIVNFLYEMLPGHHHWLMGLWRSLFEGWGILAVWGHLRAEPNFFNLYNLLKPEFWSRWTYFNNSGQEGS